jgi:hypothetical protein
MTGSFRESVHSLYISIRIMKEIMEEMENVEKKGGRESRVKAWLN